MGIKRSLLVVDMPKGSYNNVKNSRKKCKISYEGNWL